MPLRGDYMQKKDRHGKQRRIQGLGLKGAKPFPSSVFPSLFPSLSLSLHPARYFIGHLGDDHRSQFVNRLNSKHVKQEHKHV